VFDAERLAEVLQPYLQAPFFIPLDIRDAAPLERLGEPFWGVKLLVALNGRPIEPDRLLPLPRFEGPFGFAEGLLS
jgi:hypothetical protein